MMYKATVIDIEQRISKTETPYWDVTVKEDNEPFPYKVRVYSKSIVDTLSIGEETNIRVRPGRYYMGELSIF